MVPMAPTVQQAPMLHQQAHSVRLGHQAPSVLARLRDRLGRSVPRRQPSHSVRLDLMDHWHPTVRWDRWNRLRRRDKVEKSSFLFHG